MRRGVVVPWIAGTYGLHAREALQAVHAVLSTLGEVLPDGERRHLAAHLPRDVRGMLEPARRHRRGPRLGTADDFLDAAVERAGVDRLTLGPLAEALLGMLRDRVPEEAGDVAAVLPEHLRVWWQVAISA